MGEGAGGGEIMEAREWEERGGLTALSNHKRERALVKSSLSNLLIRGILCS